jgi:hypothetical protein
MPKGLKCPPEIASFIYILLWSEKSGDMILSSFFEHGNPSESGRALRANYLSPCQ